MKELPSPLPQVCATCPAKVIEGLKNFCVPEKFTKNIGNIGKAKLRPINCHLSVKNGRGEHSAQTATLIRGLVRRNNL